MLIIFPDRLHKRAFLLKKSRRKTFDMKSKRRFDNDLVSKICIIALFQQRVSTNHGDRFTAVER